MKICLYNQILDFTKYFEIAIFTLSHRTILILSYEETTLFFFHQITCNSGKAWGKQVCELLTDFLKTKNYSLLQTLQSLCKTKDILAFRN